MDSTAFFPLRKTINKEWLRAHSAWSENPAILANPLAKLLQLQTASRVGDRDRTKEFLSQVSPVFLLLSAGKQIVEAAESALKVQGERPILQDLYGASLGRLLVETGRYLDALPCWLSIEAQAKFEECDLRLAQVYTRLGEYEKAIAHLKKCAGTSFAERASPLLLECEAGLDRVKRLESRPVNLLPHPLLKEIRQAIAEDETLLLTTQGFFALALCELLDEWSDLALVLRRGLLMGDDRVLLELPPNKEDALVAFLKSAAFDRSASPRFVDYLRNCLARRNFTNALKILRGDETALAPPSS